MKVLVTGGLGFIGGVTSKLLLQRGHDVLIVDDGRTSIADKQFDWRIVVNKSIGTLPKKHIEQFKPDVVMHFAASASVGEGEKDPMAYLDNNLTEFGGFLYTAMKAGVTKVIHSGSSAVYSEPSPTACKEDWTTAPVSWYGWTKLVAERLLHQLSKSSGLEYVGFRYFNVAGAGLGVVETRVGDRLIPKILEALALGKRFTIYGEDWPTPDGTCIRDYIHVLDLAEAHIRAAERMMGGSVKNEIINLGSGKGYSIREVMKEAERVTGRELHYSVGARRPGDSAARFADVLKAKLLLEWEPQRTLADMILDSWKGRSAASRMQ